MRKQVKIKWEMALAVFMSIASIALTISYFVNIVGKETTRLNIISFIIWFLASIFWIIKALNDRKRLEELKKE